MSEYMLGRLPSDPVARAKNLRFANYAPSEMPPIPEKVRWAENVTDWGVMGNNRYGNCVIACAGHLILNWRVAELGDNNRISDEDVIDLSGEMGALHGYNVLNRLKWWQQKGMWGDKIWGYAEADVSNHDMVKLIINEFGAIDFAANMPSSWKGKNVWEVGTRPGSWGGHSILANGYDSEHLYVVTWGKIIPMSWAAWDKYVDEAYAIISPNWIAKEGISPSGFDLGALQFDRKKVTS